MAIALCERCGIYLGERVPRLGHERRAERLRRLPDTEFGRGGVKEDEGEAGRFDGHNAGVGWDVAVDGDDVKVAAEAAVDFVVVA
jgi:hypothetical protein